jgi:pyrroloquinoline-quinone synthase
MTTETRAGESLCDRIDALIEDRSLLKHPFYTKWQAGELTMDALKGYACQYYHHVLQFPTYVSGAHANCDDLPDRQELLENLVEEEQGPNNHPELWLRFGEALGLSREDMIDSTQLPETTNLITTYRRLTKDSPFIGGISALYAYESQVPGVAGTKMHGLKRFYGIDHKQGLKFFIVHHSLDVEHSKVTRNLVAKYGVTQEGEEQALGAVEEATTALNTFLDGVCREYVDAAA